MRRVLLACLLWVAVALPPVAARAAGQPSPVQVVESFYGRYLKLGVSGLPDRKQTETLTPFLSADLAKLLAMARGRQAAAIKAHPGDKPPWDDGDLFSSLFEGAQRFRVDQATVSDRNATVPVHLENRTGDQTTRWTDTFVLTRAADGWRISDVKMGGDWAFKQGATLRKTLGAR